MIKLLVITRFVIVPNGDCDCVRFIVVFPSNINWPVIVVEVIIEKEPSALKIISVKPQSTKVVLFALEATFFCLIFHLPTALVGLSVSIIICSNVAVVLTDWEIATSTGLVELTSSSSVLPPIVKPSHL